MNLGLDSVSIFPPFQTKDGKCPMILCLFGLVRFSCGLMCVKSEYFLLIGSENGRGRPYLTKNSMCGKANESRARTP